MPPGDTTRFTSHTGAPLWGVPGQVDKSTYGSNGWYVAGTFNGGDQRGWEPVEDGGTEQKLMRSIRGQAQISIALVIDKDVVDYRTVHGPVESLKILSQLIEREVMVNSPVTSAN